MADVHIEEHGVAKFTQNGTQGFDIAQTRRRFRVGAFAAADHQAGQDIEPPMPLERQKGANQSRWCDFDVFREREPTLV